MIVAQRNNANLGFIGGHEDDDDDEAMYITIIMVKEEFRCQNIGKLLIDQFEKETRKKRYEKVTLVVAVSNKAVNFFERHGFVRSDEESRFGDEFIDMTKDL